LPSVLADRPEQFFGVLFKAARRRARFSIGVDLTLTQDSLKPIFRPLQPAEVDEAFLGFARLTAREREILEALVNGETNAQAGTRLGLSHRTVEVHRRHIMRKLGARNTADLVRRVVVIEEMRRPKLRGDAPDARQTG
jgi:DNA-binding NarL/FixJ family response regulator